MSIRETTNLLDTKAYNLECLLVPIITALIGYLFLAKNNFIATIILLTGFL